MSEEEFYRSKIAEIAGKVKNLGRLRKIYTTAKTYLEIQLEEEARAEHDGTLQGRVDKNTA